MTRWMLAAVGAAAGWAMAAPASAAELRPSLLDSFRIGTAGGVLCRAQASLSDPVANGMFDRGFAIVCRDAAAPVGRLYALRAAGDAPLARIAAGRDAGIACEPFRAAAVETLAGVEAADCRMTREGVGYRVYAVRRGRVLYAAEGLAGYDSALRLGLRSLVADRVVPGEVQAATTSVANPAAFARIQAGSLSPEQALAEGYRRNNSGSYADAAGFFDTLEGRRDDPASRALMGEYVANRALQRSNLGEVAQADALFRELDRLPTRDPVQLRLRRNYRALHLVNQGRFADAGAELARPLPPVQAGAATDGVPVIDAITARQINADATAGILGADQGQLTPAERAEILDAQATQIAGTIARLRGDLPAADRDLAAALAVIDHVREGRVTAVARLRAQILGEQSAVAEARGDQPGAERLLRQASAMIDTAYPDSAAAQAARARLAAYLARHDRTDEALALYRQVVASIVAQHGTATGLERLLSPYFALLVERASRDPRAAADLFLAGQTLARPGVADTQAVLARELSGGSDEAARLFRQSVALGRDVERGRIDVARLSALPQPTADSQTQLAAAQTALTRVEADQVATQAALSRYPRYRAVESGALSLADLQASLKPDEAYLKLTQVGDDIYALFATHDAATAYRLDETAPRLADAVDAIRASIVVEVNGQTQTSPFDVDRARALYVTLFGPAAPRLAGVRHLVFEPDGAMLKLPPGLLVADDASVAAYKARAAAKDGDPFDFRGVAWLARTTDVSTAVSAQSFRDLRGATPSRAKYGYLGLGDNAPLGPAAGIARTRLVSARGGIDCEWPAAAWANPIQPAELFAARRAVGGQGDAVVTGAAFSDTALIARKDLGDYRIVHFATHGLVTAPRPECPARPALLTSFGPTLPDGTVSDGLLSFREVFGLRFDADLVILSACDTAGQADVAATREAGETSGGGTALDGLVRAFVGAGGRSVLASHWPVPNDYKATERLVAGLFESPRGTATAEAMRRSELRLMDDKDTSHPYYWAAFALVGDGAQPLLRQP